MINLNLKRVIKNEIFYNRNFRYVNSYLIFYTIKLSKKNGEFYKYILIAYIILFKNSLIFFYILKNKLKYGLFYILRLILLLFGAFCFFFLDVLNFYILDEIIDYLSVIGPIIFLVYLIIKKDISSKGVKLVLLVCYEILLAYLSLEITIAIGYQ